MAFAKSWSNQSEHSISTDLDQWECSTLVSGGQEKIGDKERESLLMSMMAAAVALAAGVMVLTILAGIFKENRRYFVKLKDVLKEKKVKCLSGNN